MGMDQEIHNYNLPCLVCRKQTVAPCHMTRFVVGEADGSKTVLANLSTFIWVCPPNLDLPA